jgi:alkylated DNA repair dioxygenase AlkB
MLQLQKIDLPDAEVYYTPAFFTAQESNRYFNELLNQVAWQQEHIKLFGKEHPMPRLTAWYGDKAYTYSGLQNKPQPWLPVLQELREEIEEASGQTYNSVLLNLYRTGQDSMGWHSDDETELGQNPTIASLSFGAVRKFSLKHKYKKNLKTCALELTNGSLLIMQGTTQHYWQHRISKTALTVESRINLTFRKVIG